MSICNNRLTRTTFLVAGVLILAQDQALATSAGGGWNTTLFGRAMATGSYNDGMVGSPMDGPEDWDGSADGSRVGITGRRDFGNNKVLFYRGEFIVHDDELKLRTALVGASGFLGSLSFGKQVGAYRKFFGSYVHQSDTNLYPVGYTRAGGTGIHTDVLKFSTSIGRLEAEADVIPNLGHDGDAIDRWTVAIQYRQFLSRFSAVVCYDDVSDEKSHADQERIGGAVRYESEKWSLGSGIHRLDNGTSNDTISESILGIFRITGRTHLHIHVANIDDEDRLQTLLEFAYFSVSKAIHLVIVNHTGSLHMRINHS